MKTFVKKKALIINKVIFFLLLIFFIISNSLYSQNKQTIKKSLGTILKQEQFNYTNPIQNRNSEKNQNDLASKISLLLEKIFYFIEKIFNKFKYIAIAFYILVSFALLYLMYLFIRRSIFGIERKKKFVKSQDNNLFNLDYKNELQRALESMQSGHYQEAISLAINALWLYYHAQKIIIFNQSLTNREYIKLLKQLSEYTLLKAIVYEGEKSVYSGIQLNEKNFNTIWEIINKIISNPGKD